MDYCDIDYFKDESKIFPRENYETPTTICNLRIEYNTGHRKRINTRWVRFETRFTLISSIVVLEEIKSTPRDSLSDKNDTASINGTQRKCRLG